MDIFKFASEPGLVYLPLLGFPCLGGWDCFGGITFGGTAPGAVTGCPDAGGGVVWATGCTSVGGTIPFDSSGKIILDATIPLSISGGITLGATIPS